MERTVVEPLIGQVILRLERADLDNQDAVLLTTALGKYALTHIQDCCETVWLEDVCGDLDRLIGTRIAICDIAYEDGTTGESSTWTFSRIGNDRGDMVTIRFCGESNGYYSEAAAWYQIKGPSRWEWWAV